MNRRNFFWVFLLGFFGLGASRRRQRPAKARARALPDSFTAGDKRQMLHSFSEADIRTELAHRWLMDYSVEEMERELKLRKIEAN